MSILVGNAGQKILKRELLREYYNLKKDTSAKKAHKKEERDKMSEKDAKEAVERAERREVHITKEQLFNLCGKSVVVKMMLEEYIGARIVVV